MKLKKMVNRSFFHLFTGTFFSKILGFVREIIAAAFFGASSLYDAFIVAFTIPSFFRRIFGEDMFEQSFMQRFKRIRAEGNELKARKFLVKVFIIVSISMFILTAILYFFSYDLVRLIAPGFKGEQLLQTVELTKIILPFIILIGFATFVGAIILYSGDEKFKKSNLVYSTAPGIWNIVIIIVLVLFHKQLGIKSLVIAYLLGTFAFIFYQLPYLFKVLKSIGKENKGGDKKSVDDEVKESLIEGIKLFFTTLTGKTVEIVDRIIASLLSAGSISALWFSYRVILLPHSIISLSISRSIAPKLSYMKGKKNKKGFLDAVYYGFDFGILVLLPLMILFMIFSREIIEVIYHRGAFDKESLNLTSIAFYYYSISLLPAGLVALLKRVYAALEDYKIPLYAGIFAGILNVVLDIVLYKTALKHGGIALATSIAFFLNMLIMLVYLKKKINLFKILKVVKTFVISLLSAIPLFVMFSFRETLIGSDWGTLKKLIITSIYSIIGVLLYVIILVFIFSLRKRSSKMRIILTGGGTGGHVYPALSIYQILKSNKNLKIEDVLYVGIKGRAEEKIVPKYGLKLKFIKSATPNSIRSLISLGVGIVQSIFILIKFKPNLIVATGSYVSFPIVFSSFLLKPFMKTKLIVEEQNINPGMVNKISSLIADLVFVNFKETAFSLFTNKIVHIGYPLRKEFYSKVEFDKKEFFNEKGLELKNRKLILIFGGSLGARSINRAVVDSLDRLIKEELLIVHAIGMYDTKEYSAFEDAKKLLVKKFKNIKVDGDRIELKDNDGNLVYLGFRYIDDMFYWQIVSDLIVSRAGAGAISEISALKKPLIIIPKRGLPGDHQELNVIGIAEKGACEVIFEKRDKKGFDYIESKEFTERLVNLVKDEKRLKLLSDNISKLFIEDSKQKILESIEKLVNSKDIEYLSFINIKQPLFVRFQNQFDSLIAYLDRMKKQGYTENLFFRFYKNKIDEYYSSNNYLIKNRAIKLIGALQVRERYGILIKEFKSLQGYLRRNILIGFQKTDNYYRGFETAIEYGMNDSYYEVRREAVNLYVKFYEKLKKNQFFKDKVIEFLESKYQSFEVKVASMKAIVLIENEEDIYKRLLEFVNSRNIRLREGVLDAIVFGLKHGYLKDKKRVLEFLREILVSTSDYEVIYRIKKKYNSVIELLIEEEGNNG